MRTPDEEEAELTELRWGHLGPVWVSPWGRFGGLWGCPRVSGRGVSCASFVAVPGNNSNVDSRWFFFSIARRFLPRRFPWFSNNASAFSLFLFVAGSAFSMIFSSGNGRGGSWHLRLSKGPRLG